MLRTLRVSDLAIIDEKYHQESAELRVVVNNYEDITPIVTALRKHVETGVFSSVEGKEPRTTKDGKIEVPIRMEIVQLAAGDVVDAL